MEKHQLFSLKKTEEKQLLLIMKFFSFFLLIGIGHCLATNSYSQSKLFTMKTSQKTVKQVFQEIEKNSEYIIFYMDQIIDTNRKVNICLLYTSSDLHHSALPALIFVILCLS